MVRPLRLGSDGAYELTLDLTPAELGRVRIDVELRGATINLTLRADNPAAREALNASLNQLRSELESAGLDAGQLDVGGQGAGEHDATGQDLPGGAPAPLSALGNESADTDQPTQDPSDVTDGVDVMA